MRILFLIAALALAACGEEDHSHHHPADASPGDARPADAGPADAGAGDAQGSR